MELKLSQEQIDSLLNVDEWDKKQCLGIMTKCLNRMQVLDEADGTIKRIQDDVPALEEALARTPKKNVVLNTRKTGKKWSKDDKEFLKNRFIQYKGNITEKRFDTLCKSLKRSFGSVRTQLSLNRGKWLKEIGKITVKISGRLPEQKPKSKSSKWMKKVAVRAKEIRTEQPNIKYKEAVSMAMKQLAKKVDKILPEKKKSRKPRKTDKIRAHQKRVHKLAREIRAKDPSMRYIDAVGMASKQLRKDRVSGKGDAHTQQPRQTEPDKQSEVPFPRIYPLSQLGNDSFINVCKDLVFNPAKVFDYKDAKVTLNLANEMEWTKLLWGQFCDQVRYSSDALCNYFDVTGSFGFEWDGNLSVIKYKRG